MAVDDVQICRNALTDAQILDLATQGSGVNFIANVAAGGSFTVSYKASDAAGNSSSATCTVVAKPAGT